MYKTLSEASEKFCPNPKPELIYDFLKTKIYFYFPCMSLLLSCMLVPGACGGWKRVLGPLGLELQELVLSCGWWDLAWVPE